MVQIIEIGSQWKDIWYCEIDVHKLKTRVFSNGIKSEPFTNSLGVRQGECLSPFLFSMYLNDLEYELSIPNAGIDIGYMKLMLLMYADDVVIFANSAESLQAEIDRLYMYCMK